MIRNQFDIVDQRKTPLFLMGLVLEVLRGHFATNSKDYKYKKDSAETGIAIEPFYKWNTNLIQARPALYIKRGGIAYERLGMDDLKTFNYPEGEKEHVVQVRVVFVIFVVAKIGAEIERLVEEILDILLAYKSVLRERYDLTRFDCVSVGEVSLAQESREIFVIPITLNLSYVERWDLKMDSLKLQEIVLEAEARVTQNLGV